MEHLKTPPALTARSPWSFATSNLVLAILGIEAGISVGLAFLAQPLSEWSSATGAITATSRIGAMLGTYLALVCLVLIARVPWLEREIGQDRLVKWHRTLAPYSLYLILIHVVLVVLGYAGIFNTNMWNEFWRMVLGNDMATRWMFAAFVGFIFMMMVGITSYKRARSRMKYETWWLLHLYSYLGIALAFMHQIETGTMFVDKPIMKIWWISLYVFVAAFILGFRIVVPLVRSRRHDLKVERVVRESRDTISVVIAGRNVDELKASGGQFFAWRFLDSHHWWEAHPYSLSASPRNDRLRITVKNLGDHSHWLSTVKPGTRVMVEGPYGVFTAHQSESPHAVLIAGGVGITPIRALLEELPANVNIDVIWRASTEKDLVLRQEVEALADWRGARIHFMVGSRKQYPLSPARLKKTVPHIQRADVFMCGPNGLIHEARESLLALGLSPDSIHDEAFAY